MKVHFILLDRGFKFLHSIETVAPPLQNTTVVLPSGNRTPRWAEYRIKEVISQYGYLDNQEQEDAFAFHRAFIIVVKQKDTVEATRRIDSLAATVKA